MIKILFVCHGNICRSTMAESVMTYLVKQKKMEQSFYINSAATSREEIGNPPHHGTVGKLREMKIPIIAHRAVQMTMQDYNAYDYLIGMDTANIRNMTRIAGGDNEGKIYKLLSFPAPGRMLPTHGIQGILMPLTLMSLRAARGFWHISSKMTGTNYSHTVLCSVSPGAYTA